MKALYTITTISLFSIVLSSCSSENAEPATTSPTPAPVTKSVMLWDVVQQNDEAVNTRVIIDDDSDGAANSDDNCPTKPNQSQSDIDHDGMGDVCDDNIDGDEWPNIDDVCPTTFSLTNDPVLDVCPAECDGQPMPKMTNPSRKKVTEEQLIARILVKTAGRPPTPSELTDHVKAVFKATRDANNKTESWNNCQTEESWYFTEWSGLLDNPDLPKLVFGEEYDAAFYSNAQRIIVAQSGTGISGGDLFTDIRGFIPKTYSATGMKFHRGFYYHWFDSGYRDKIFSYAPNDGAGKSVYFAGHSLGAASSMVAIYDYVIRTNTSSKKLPHLYTFGSPAVVRKSNSTCSWHLSRPFRRCVTYREEFEKTRVYGDGRQTRLGDLIHNYANTDKADNRNDPVPHLGHILYGHVGYHHFMDRLESLDGTYVINKRIPSSDFKVDASVAIAGSRKLKELAGLPGVNQHDTCFYAVSLGHVIDGSPSLWFAEGADRPECNN